MTKIITFEGVHGSGKGTLIEFFLKELEAKYSGKYAVLRDSEYPEFEAVKEAIRSGRLSGGEEIITTVAETRERIYQDHIFPQFRTLDLVLLDRSYHTSAVWQSDSLDQMYKIIAANESRGIPRADLTFILYAPAETIMDRLRSRGRDDLSEHGSERILRNLAKYLHLADNCQDCVAFKTDKEPANLAREAYNLSLVNKAL